MVAWMQRFLKWLSRRLNEVQFLHVAAAQQLHPWISRTDAWGWVCRLRKLVLTGLGVYKCGQSLQRSCKGAQECGTSGVMLTCMYLTARSAMTNVNLWVQANGAVTALMGPTQPSQAVIAIMTLFAFPGLRMNRVLKSSRLAGALKGLWTTLKGLDLKLWLGSVGAIMLKFTHPAFGKVHRVIQAAKKVVRATSGVKGPEWGLAAVLMIPKLRVAREWVMQSSGLDAGATKLVGCINALVQSGEWPLVFMAVPLKCHLMNSPAEAKLLEHSVAVVNRLNEWTNAHPAPATAFMMGMWCAAIPDCHAAISSVFAPVTRLKQNAAHKSKRLTLSRSMRVGSRLLLPPAPIATGPNPAAPSTQLQPSLSAPVTSGPSPFLHSASFKDRCLHIAEATVQQLFVVGGPSSSATSTGQNSITIEDVSGNAGQSSSATGSQDATRGLTLRSAWPSVRLSSAQPVTQLAVVEEDPGKWVGLDAAQGFMYHASTCAVCGDGMEVDEREWEFYSSDVQHDGYVGLLGQFHACGECQAFHVCEECHHGRHDQKLRDACWVGSAFADYVKPLSVTDKE